MVITDIAGWILHRKNTSENSAYITFFTRQLGVVTALCHSCNSRKRQSILQQFSPLWADFNEKTERLYVNKIEAQGASLNFSKDCLFSALYINEVLYHLLQPFEEYPDLFDLYVSTITGLSEKMDKPTLEIILRKFEFTLLSAIGYGINLTHTAYDLQIVNSDTNYHYNPEIGLVKTKDGIPGKHILAIAEQDFTDKQTLKYAKLITKRAIDNCLSGKEIKSRSLYAGVVQ